MIRASAWRGMRTRGTTRPLPRRIGKGFEFRCGKRNEGLMLSSRFKPWHVPLFLAKYAWLGLRRRPVLVHFEVTMRCNARCGFCDYWKTPATDRASELRSFADAARFFNPMLVTFTGG